MDAATLATQIGPWLIAAAPYLWKLGKSASEEAAKEIGSDLPSEIWNGAKSIWRKIVGSQAAAQPNVTEALREVADNPNDSDLQASLRVQLKKLLQQDDELRQAVAKIVEDVRAAQNISMQGERNVQIGGNVTGGTIVTGDGNVVGNQNFVTRSKD